MQEPDCKVRAPKIWGMYAYICGPGSRRRLSAGYNTCENHEVMVDHDGKQTAVSTYKPVGTQATAKPTTEKSSYAGQAANERST